MDDPLPLDEALVTNFFGWPNMVRTQFGDFFVSLAQFLSRVDNQIPRLPRALLLPFVKTTAVKTTAAHVGHMGCWVLDALFLCRIIRFQPADS